MNHRYPLAPLAAVLHIDLGQVGGHQPGGDPSGLAALAMTLDISHKWAQALNRHGLTDRTADRLAVRAGHHPSDIWPSWFDDADGEDDDWYGDDPSMADLDLAAAS